MTMIPVVVEPAAELEPGTLGVGDAGARIALIDAEKLRQSITELTGKITDLFQDIKAVGDYQLKEVQVQLEINTEGGVSLVGSLKAGARGAITLTFSD